MSEEKEVSFADSFKAVVQPLVDLLSGTNTTQFYLNRRREGIDSYTNEWDVVLVDPTQNSPKAEPEIKGAASKQNRSKKNKRVTV